MEMFRISKKVEGSSKPRPLLIKFESLVSKDNVLDNSSRLKDSESFSNVILSLDLSKEDREECKKLQEIKRGQPEGRKWVIRIRGHPDAYHAIANRRRAVE